MKAEGATREIIQASHPVITPPSRLAAASCAYGRLSIFIGKKLGPEPLDQTPRAAGRWARSQVIGTVRWLALNEWSARPRSPHKASAPFITARITAPAAHPLSVPRTTGTINISNADVPICNAPHLGLTWLDGRRSLPPKVLDWPTRINGIAAIVPRAKNRRISGIFRGILEKLGHSWAESPRMRRGHPAQSRFRHRGALD
jgi:hypothetical protein